MASVSSDTFDNNPDNDTDSAVVDAVAADLSLVKDVSVSTASVGDTVEWTITVRNDGPDDATGVVVGDVIPDGVAFESADPESAFDPDTGEWTIGDVASGDEVSLVFSTTVTDPGELTNVAQIVAADQFDPDSTVDNDDGDQSEDDEDSATLTVPAIIDLELTQEIDATEVVVGDTVTFTISVTNDSLVEATGVSVATELPDHFVSGDLSFVDSNNPAVVSDPSADWVIGTLAPGETATLTVEATVNVAGDISNVAEIATADQDDIDSTVGNYVDGRVDFQDDGDGDRFEDDEAEVTVTSAVPFTANPNELEVEGTGGASINAVVVIDRSSSMREEVTIGDVTMTRLEWNIQAVEGFAARSEVKAVKVIAFDGRVTDGAEIFDGRNPDLPGGGSNFPLSDGGPNRPTNEVSEWINTSAGGSELNDFLETINPWGSGTNYQAAIDATMAQTDTPPPGAEETNFYFFSDGVPTAGGTGDPTNQMDDDHQLIDVSAWQDFAEANFDNTFAVGFAGAVDARDALEEIAHITGSPDDPTIDDDPNVLLVDEIDAIPSVLGNFADTSVSGNAIADDISENDFSITSIEFDGVTYNFANGLITESGPSQGATLTNSFVVVDSTSEGSLQFDFNTGDFTYFAPVTDVSLTESFDYTITDTTGAESTSTVTINVTPSPVTDPALTVSSDELVDDGELFASDTMAEVRLPEDTADTLEWASDDSRYDADQYDASLLVL